MRSFLAKFVLCAFALTLVVAATPTVAPAQIGITVSFGPPAIPYYEQPATPHANWIWSPGYWQYDLNDGDYYWVPGTWVQAPQYGYLWTPGYWAWNGDTYFWTRGYWATSVGYYGGVNYGYGYYGRGYVGGRWNGRQFAYNTAVTRVNRTIVHNVYVNRTVVVNNWNRVSYNGGRGGVEAHATAAEMAVQRAHHFAPTAVQVYHQQYASQSRAQYSRTNQGRPQAAAVARPYSAPNRAPQAHAAAAARPQAMHAAPVHAAPVRPALQEHRMAPQMHAVPQARPQPQVHAAPQMRPAPEVHRAPPQMMHAAPQAHAAPPARPAAPAGDDKHEHHDGH